MTGSARASGSSSSGSLPNVTSKPTGVRPGLARLEIEEQIEVTEEGRPLPLEDVIGRRRHRGPQRLELGLAERAQARAVPRVEALPAAPLLPAEAGVEVVKERAARQGIEPHVRVRLGVVRRRDPEAALEEVPERAAGQPLQRRRRHDAARRRGIEDRARGGHPAVVLREGGAVAGGLRRRALRQRGEGAADDGAGAGPRAAEAREPPAGIAQRRVARRGHRRHGLAEGSAQVLVRERPAGLAEAERLEDEPGRERLAALAEIAAGIAEADGAAQHRQAAHDVMERLGHPVGGPDQERVEALALGVEEHGILEQRREDAPLLQPQDERVRAAGVAGAGERRDVETPRPRAVAADREAGQAVSHEAQDLGLRTQEVPEGVELVQGVPDHEDGRAVQRAADGGESREKRPRAGKERAGRDRVALAGRRGEAQQLVEDGREPLDLPRPRRGGRPGGVVDIRILGPLAKLGRQRAERRAVGLPAPQRAGLAQEPRGLARRRAVVEIEPHVARLEEMPERAGAEAVLVPREEPEERARRPRARDRHAALDRDRPVVALRLLPDQRGVLVAHAGDLDRVERPPGGQDPPERVFHLGLAAAGPHQGHGAVAAGWRRRLGPQEPGEPLGVRGGRRGGRDGLPCASPGRRAGGAPRAPAARGRARARARPAAHRGTGARAGSRARQAAPG